MIESISDLKSKYSFDSSKAAEVCSSYYSRKESINILEILIQNLEKNLVAKIEHNNEIIKNDYKKISEIIEPKDITLARTYIEAYVNALYSLTDIMAFLFYNIFNLNVGIAKLYFNQLPNLLSNIANEDLRICVNELLNTEEYKYFNALNNTIKHRTVIGVKNQVNINNSENIFIIKKFKRNNTNYSEINSKELFIKSDKFITNLEKCINLL